MTEFENSNEFIKFFQNMENFSKEINQRDIKISLIGCGELGGTCIASIIFANLPVNIVLIEPIEKNFGSERQLYESLSYCAGNNSQTRLTCSNDISQSANSDICLIAFEKERKDKENKLSYSTILENICNFYKYIPGIIKLSPNVILIQLTYPFTILTQLCYKICEIPKQRIIGIGTSLSTSEFKVVIAKTFNISPTEVNGYVIGLEDYNLQIPVWSTVSICGVPLTTLVPLAGTEDDPLHLYQELNLIEQKRRKLLEARGPPRWTIGLLCAKICKAIVYNTKEIFTIPVNLRGIHDITGKCFVCVPCSIGRNGIHSIIGLNLNLKEKELLHKVAYFSESILLRNELKSPIYQKNLMFLKKNYVDGLL